MQRRISAAKRMKQRHTGWYFWMIHRKKWCAGFTNKLLKQDAKEQGPRPRKKSSFFTKVTGGVSLDVLILYRHLLGPLNVPISHGSQVVGSVKPLPR